MDVYEAVKTRHAVRKFVDQPIEPEALRRVLSAAVWAPSGSNLQPWHAFVVTGAPLAELKKRIAERIAAGEAWDEPQYTMYPDGLKSPYQERRADFGRQRYGSLGISRADVEAWQRAATDNWAAFGAPAALFCYIDREMGRPQWSDAGMFLQTVMLLLRAEGLHSCAQMAWAKFHRSVAEVVSPPDDLILFCGMSIGYEDTTVDLGRVGRAPLNETVTFVDG
ncbi:nitroreductase family protein [Kutzneria sp. NPDC051319]|uniref:nitroreductase family protein n=1 Tax=Kutzneria sp. NPDC051319 TaxID=3155047 RepID=UPI0034285727